MVLMCYRVSQQARFAQWACAHAGVGIASAAAGDRGAPELHRAGVSAPGGLQQPGDRLLLLSAQAPARPHSPGPAPVRLPLCPGRQCGCPPLSGQMPEAGTLV